MVIMLYGEGEIIDIECNVDFGGSIYFKGVMILLVYFSLVFGCIVCILLIIIIIFE